MGGSARLAIGGFGVLVLLAAGPAAAQSDPAALAGSEAESPRSPIRVLDTPLSLSVVSREEFVRGRTAFDLAEGMELVPGTFPQSARNGAQDARIAIRGYDSRAPFGIRGIKMLVDGFPTTLADGQSEVDSIDLAFADRIEVVRGPISSLYGGGGGGLVSISTLEPTAEPLLELRSQFGSRGLARHEGIARGTSEGTGWVLGLTRSDYGGYRDHATTRQNNLLAKLERELGDGSRVGLNLSSVWAPRSEDPGGLTVTEESIDRQDAAPLAAPLGAGERLDQHRVGLSFAKPLGPGSEVEARGWWLGRDFRGSLPFVTGGRLRIAREAGGGSLVYRQQRGRLRGAAGADLDLQQDHRQRFDNVNGSYGALLVDQSESVRALGLFSELDVELPRRFGAVAGVRWDWTEFVVGDRIATPADASDRFRYRELSPRIGLHWKPADAVLTYANLATAFRVPTTTEFAPGALRRGFDDSLEPEHTVGVELGARGLVSDWLLYEAVLFELHLRDALIPFQDATGQQRARNAAQVRRRGFELGASALLHPWLSLRTAYTWSHFRYRDYDVVNVGLGTVTSFDGEREPNVPEHSLVAELRFDHPSGAFATAALRLFTDLEVNDANTLESPGGVISDLRAGWTLHRGALAIEPFAGLRNWTGVEYDGTLRPNANAGRYFEPNAEIEVYSGLAIRMGR